MTEAHVPPRAVGNQGPGRQRAQWVAADGGARLGRWQAGGLSVYGLCDDCNRSTSNRADPAYIDFHWQVAQLMAPGVRRLLLRPGDLPARVAPGLVVRSVLAGMFATNDRLYDRYPELARGLREDLPALRLPEDLRLMLAITPGPRSRLGGPVGYMRVLTVRQIHMPLAEVWFPPLAWCLRTARASEPSLGPDLTWNWGDVTEWVCYGPDLVTDLRNVVGTLPVVSPPEFGADDWMVLTSDEVMAALDGRPAS